MSKYKYEFGLSLGYVSGNRAEKVDLVEDWGVDEEWLDSMTGDEIEEYIYSDGFEEWKSSYLEEWVRRIDG